MIKGEKWLIFFALGVIAIPRLLYIGRYPDSWDTVDFALGVVRYDIYNMQPHFPGYPLYLLPTKWMNKLVSEPIISLSLVSAIAGIIMIPLIYFTIKNWLGKKIALFTTILSAVNPLLWLMAEQPMSDSLGMMMIWVVLWIISRTFNQSLTQSEYLRTGIIASFVYGLAMGVRISYFPFVAVLLLPLLMSSFDLQQRIKWRTLLRHTVLMALSLFFGLALWFFPVAYTEGGLLPYLRLGIAFTSGHFTDWGGTVLTSPRYLDRVESFIKLIWVSLGGKSWIISFFLFGGLLWIVYHFLKVSKKIRLFPKYFHFQSMKSYRCLLYLLSTIPYILWAFIGQNLDKPRHVAILIPFILIGFVWSLGKIGRLSKLIFLGLAFVTMITSIPLVEQYAVEKPPMVQLANQINQSYHPEQTTIFTWEEQRVIQYLYPDYQTIRLRNPADFENQILIYGENRRILVTNAVLDGFGEQKGKYAPYLKPVFQTEADSFLYPTYYQIVLYEALPELYEKLKH
ncbi:hypothetical protein HK1_01503 [Tepidibacillus sp. HK-1]|nr:hypothetical protein HK1_01503 [Tepidibacillus sp. HK-1]